MRPLAATAVETPPNVTPSASATSSGSSVSVCRTVQRGRTTEAPSLTSCARRRTRGISEGRGAPRARQCAGLPRGPAACPAGLESALPGERARAFIVASSTTSSRPESSDATRMAICLPRSVWPRVR
eukprot:3327752-Prymnesium_polylepis.1